MKHLISVQFFYQSKFFLLWAKLNMMRTAMLCYSYDPKEDKWTVLAEMNTARALAGCTVFKNKIYIVGEFFFQNSILI